MVRKFSMFKKLCKRLAYFGLHPLLRLYYLFLRPRSYAARAVVRYKDEILLIKNIGVDYWSLPGGKLEKGETPESCLERELAEEVALSNVKIDYKLGTYLSRHEGHRDLIHIFVVRPGSFYHRRQWEIDESEWFPIGQLPENLSPATRQRLAEYFAGRRSLAGVW